MKKHLLVLPVFLLFLATTSCRKCTVCTAHYIEENNTRNNEFCDDDYYPPEDLTGYYSTLEKGGIVEPGWHCQ